MSWIQREQVVRPSVRRMPVEAEGAGPGTGAEGAGREGRSPGAVAAADVRRARGCMHAAGCASARSPSVPWRARLGA